MKKLTLILLLCCLGCGEHKEKEETPSIETETPAQAESSSEEAIPEKASICFRSIGKEITSGNKTLRDSTLLYLELEGEVVTGTFDWIPAEKDSRRGVIQATKNADEVKGNYAFMQEGIQDTIFIEIQLQDKLALVTMLSEGGEETKMEVERVDCNSFEK